MQDLVAVAGKVAAVLTARRQTIVIAESSTAGLISTALLAVPGASAYFLGGAVVYTRQSRRLLLEIPDAALEGMRPSTEPYALMMARSAQRRFSSSWALAETTRIPKRPIDHHDQAQNHRRAIHLRCQARNRRGAENLRGIP